MILIERVQPKFSHGRSDGGRWGHHPRRIAQVGVPTNRRQNNSYCDLTELLNFVKIPLQKFIRCKQKNQKIVLR